jgi:hypothetical protein
MKRYDIKVPSETHCSFVSMTEATDGDYVTYEEAIAALKEAAEKARKEERKRIISVIASRLKLSRLSSGEVSRGWQLAIDNVNATILALEDGEEI